MRTSLRRAAGGVTSAGLALGLVLAVSPGLGGCGRRAPALLADSLIARGAGGELRLLRLRDGRGAVHEGWLRLSGSQPPGGYEPVLILGGIGTGRRATEIVPAPPGYALLALDYTYEGPRAPTRRELIRHAPEIHRAAHAAPHGVAAALRHLAERPGMSRRGTLVVGASFGVPFVLRGIALLERERDGAGADIGPRGVRAVSLLFGGGDLPELARYRLRERPRWEREAAAWSLQLLFSEIEPLRWVGRISPRPVLLVNGARDEFVSPASARALARAARQPKTQIWLPSAHLQPDAEALLRELVGRTLQWLREVEAAGPQRARNPGESRNPNGGDGV